jgi:hypothetical protein
MPKLLQAGLSRGLAPFNRILDRLERRWVAKAPSMFEAPPIFIIGAPRTGSTLLYQLLLNRFEFGYFSNLHARLYGAPTLVARMLGRRIRQAAPFEYASDHGNTRGLLGPSEAGAFWYRWFPRHPQYVGVGDFDMEALESLRRVLAEVTRISGAPLLLKNMPAALRLRALGPLLPEACFIVVTRDALWTAQSILRARVRLRGDASRWWSLEPPTIDDLGMLPPAEQAVRQVRDIEETIEADARGCGPDRFLWVRYEDLCADPGSVLERIRSFVRDRSGFELKVRGSVPDRIPISERPRLDPGEYEALVAAVERIDREPRVRTDV